MFGVFDEEIGEDNALSDIDSGDTRHEMLKLQPNFNRNVKKESSHCMAYMRYRNFQTKYVPLHRSFERFCNAS